jgi:alpha-1,3-glucan synthase
MEIRRLLGKEHYCCLPTNVLTFSKPLDLTLLDHHFGDINEWRAAVDEIHKRGMYLVLDHTMST